MRPACMTGDMQSLRVPSQLDICSNVDAAAYCMPVAYLMPHQSLALIQLSDMCLLFWDPCLL